MPPMVADIVAVEILSVWSQTSERRRDGTQATRTNEAANGASQTQGHRRSGGIVIPQAISSTKVTPSARRKSDGELDWVMRANASLRQMQGSVRAVRGTAAAGGRRVAISRLQGKHSRM